MFYLSDSSPPNPCVPWVYNDEGNLCKSNLIFKSSSITDNPINIHSDERTDKLMEMSDD